MLDSTGSRLGKEIPCFVCEGNKLSFVVYTPKYGHDGNPLKVGSCIERDTLKHLDGSLLLEVRPYREMPEYAVRDGSEPLVFKKTSLIINKELYHYNGFHIPDFGWSIGQTIWVCSSCSKCQEDELVHKLSRSFYQKVSREMEVVVYQLFSLGILEIAPTTKTKLRRVLKKDKKELLDNLNTLVAVLQSMNNTESVTLARRKLKQVYKALV